MWLLPRRVSPRKWQKGVCAVYYFVGDSRLGNCCITNNVCGIHERYFIIIQKTIIVLGNFSEKKYFSKYTKVPKIKISTLLDLTVYIDENSLRCNTCSIMLGFRHKCLYTKCSSYLTWQLHHHYSYFGRDMFLWLHLPPLKDFSPNRSNTADGLL